MMGRSGSRMGSGGCVASHSSSGAWILPTWVGRGLTLAPSPELHAVLLERVLAQLEAEPRRLGDCHEAIDDLRLLAEQFEPQRVARRVRERFQDEAGRAGGHRVNVDLRI